MYAYRVAVAFVTSVFFFSAGVYGYRTADEFATVVLVTMLGLGLLQLSTVVSE